MTAPVAPMEARSTVTPLEALKRLIEVAKTADAMGFEELGGWNKFQTELAVCEMVVRDALLTLNDERAALVGKLEREALDAKLAPVAPQPAEATGKIMAWLSADGTEAKTAETKAWMETRDYGVWTEVAKRYVTPLYAAPQPSDKAASFWSEVEVRNHEVRPAQQVEAVGQVTVANALMLSPTMARIWFGDQESADCWAVNNGLDPEALTPLYTAPQLEAQQAGDVARDAARLDWLSKNAAYVGVNPHARTCIWTLRGIFEIPGSDFRSAIDAAIAQGRKA